MNFSSVDGLQSYVHIVKLCRFRHHPIQRGNLPTSNTRVISLKLSARLMRDT